MAFEIKQTLKLSQNLVMTPQLQQAIKLLQLNRLEMQEMINQELVENPCLEEVAEVDAYQDENDSSNQKLENMENQEAEGSNVEQMMSPQGEEKIVEGKAEVDWEEYMESFASGPSLPSTREIPDELPNYENMVTNKTDLVSHLEWQISMSDLAEDERLLARMIIGNLNDNGFFTGSIADIAKELNFDPEDAEEVLKMIQHFDPLGVAARDLRECLLVQAEFFYEKDALVLKIIRNHLEDLEKRNLAAICKATGAPEDYVKEAAREIREDLDPKPGRSFGSGTSEVQYIVPDVYVYKVGEDYAIQLNEDGLPKLRVSAYYKKILTQAKAEARAHAKGDHKMMKDYLQERLKSAVWLIKSIHNRQKTIYRVMESIVKHQRDFFDKGVHFLKPMVLREVASDIGVHESTISRVTTNKYVHTPVGTFELKYFFNSGISSGDGSGDVASESVKEKIRSLISKEDAKRPLSDQKLVELLQEDSIEIARRTVAKYRESMNILSSARRKKLF